LRRTAARAFWYRSRSIRPVTSAGSGAAQTCPTLRGKKITAHVLRHTAAMRLLHAGIDSAVIALWMGHEQVETTKIYLHADLALKEQAINRTTPRHTTPGRYRPPDTVLPFLDSL
jgi:integrase/recombinase XerD